MMLHRRKQPDLVPGGRALPGELLRGFYCAQGIRVGSAATLGGRATRMVRVVADDLVLVTVGGHDGELPSPRDLHRGVCGDRAKPEAPRLHALPGGAVGCEHRRRLQNPEGPPNGHFCAPESVIVRRDPRTFCAH